MKDEEKYYVAIDKEVMVEVLEYLAKTKLEKIGSFGLGDVIKDGSYFFVEIVGVEEDKLKKFSPQRFLGEKKDFGRVRTNYNVVASLEGRTSVLPAESFRLSRKIGKIMEEKIDAEKRRNIPVKASPKKKIAVLEKGDERIFRDSPPLKDSTDSSGVTGTSAYKFNKGAWKIEYPHFNNEDIPF